MKGITLLILCSNSCMCISEGQVSIVSYHLSVYCCFVEWLHTITTGSVVQQEHSVLPNQ